MYTKLGTCTNLVTFYNMMGNKSLMIVNQQQPVQVQTQNITVQDFNTETASEQSNDYFPRLLQ